MIVLKILLQAGAFKEEILSLHDIAYILGDYTKFYVFFKVTYLNKK